jgi:hypothetical protein
MKLTTTALAALLLITGGSLLYADAPATAPAAGAPAKHPRRKQVNKRLKNQKKRINQKEKDGQISPAQAKDLHKQDHQIHQEEKDMASQDGGHITKQDQKTLNQQENHVSQEIGK